ncbi:ribonuclease R [Rhodoblastus acidophilus]|uniref:Ribonuclease R n=1 Tax=Candidatus Rhodoblastus alkanivorans TaxID=2954117 RepID=A0ABS9Z672_9HYPH|nr:ribonuclease R [Candidatus Rhodoblastus alkanivorans]MCI4679177.1 ribonuclease R [Candidatus Rhodoblastus alkanivorans]MCI4683173.1 ribonuclease R [Candidatus Rhodoblastus alkanivorans]MDI4640485.1 ribonuclease R [Rhodoblastus acidophilus]
MAVPKKPAPIPSREDILAFIARERAAAAEAGAAIPEKIGKREIARAFGIRGDDKILLKKILKELEIEGEIKRSRKGLHEKGALPQIVLADIISRDRDGDLIATPAEWEEELGPTPRIVIFSPKKPRFGARPGAPAAGIGDRALVRVTPTHETGGPAYSGRVVKLLSRAAKRVLGIFRDDPRGGGGRIVPVDKKLRDKEFRVAEADRGEARDGDLVSVETLSRGRLGLPVAKVRERLGSMNSEKAISLIAINVHGIPDIFRPETLEASEHARPARMEAEGFRREDWRSLPLVTIDPPDAKDHDDAVHAAPDDAPDNPEGFIVTVAIADVSWYVRSTSALDREALDRGNSVYFPDRVVPMLPERISNDLCSLRQGEDRPALACRMRIGKDGHKLDHSFHRVMMRSAAKLSYQQAQDAIDGRPDETTRPLLDEALRPLWRAHEATRIAREKRSPLDLDLPERKILLKPDGTVDRVLTPPRLDAHKLIEEFMILANVSAAETLEAEKSHLIYRAHDEPSLEKLNALSEFLATIGIKLAKGQVLKPMQFNAILAKVRGTEHENVVNEIVLRTQAQAEYVAENYGHFGLHLRRYAHFTSPIRRYADLIVHRALVRALDLGPGGLPEMGREHLAEIAARISAAERRAMAAERETTDRLIAVFLADKIGASFEGRIAGVTPSGLFVKLADTGADGFVPASTLGNDFFRFEAAHLALIGSRSGETFQLGDAVTVRLVEAAPFAGALRFEMLSEGKPRIGRATAIKSKVSRARTVKPSAKASRRRAPA